MQSDPKKISTERPNQPNPKNETRTKDDSSSSNMGGMIGEGRSNENSRGGMKGEE